MAERSRCPPPTCAPSRAFRLARPALAAACIAVGCAQSPLAGAPGVGPLADVPVELVLPGISGTPIDLAALRGDIVLVDIMATWSLASQALIPTYRRLLAAFAPDLKL